MKPSGNKAIGNFLAGPSDELPGIKVSRTSSLAINSLTNKVCVANFGFNMISVINGSDDNVISQVRTAKESPWQVVVVNFDTNMIYIHTSEDYGLTIMDGIVNKIISNATDHGSTVTCGDTPVLTIGMRGQTEFILPNSQIHSSR